MKNIFTQKVASVYANWDKLLVLADNFNKKFNRGRLDVFHYEFFIKEFNIWDITWNVFGFYIQAPSLIEEGAKHGFITMINFPDIPAILNSLEKACEKNGVINVNNFLIEQISQFKDKIIPVDVFIKLLDSMEPIVNIDSSMEPIDKTLPDKPTEEFLNTLRRILILKDKVKMPDEARISTNVEEMKQTLDKCLGQEKKQNSLNDLMKKHNAMKDRGPVK